MVEEGRVTQTAALILMQSVDEALDAAMKNKGLADWKGLRPHVQFPTYLKHLRLRNSSIIPRKLLNFLVAERIEFGCIISAAYLRAHRSARCQLREFIGESNIAEVVIKESEEQEAAAKTFLEDVRLTFPEVLRAVKTKQVTHAILNNLVDYISGLEKSGILEGKETNHLRGVVQADLKRLLRNPPLVKSPSVVETLRAHPFIGSQPVEIQEALINSAKEAMKLRSNLLYSEHCRAEGIWLVVNGVVKLLQVHILMQWKNAASAMKHHLHPTFPHGSTLGLYEVLTGKPYLCDMRADSVVHCFFLDGSHILAALQTRPEVEDFYWKESLLAVTKILMPERFEGSPLHDLRVLIMERCIMRIYLKGEIIEISPGEVGFLLEGFVKKEGTEEILMAPCVLTDGFDRSDCTSVEDAAYHVESRARIAMLDLSILQPMLRRASTAHMSSAMLHASASSFEHEGLMRWPASRQASELQAGTLGRFSAQSKDQNPTSLNNSAKTMQIIRKVRSSSRSWTEINNRRTGLAKKAHHNSQQLPGNRKQNMSTSMLPLPQSEAAGLTQTRQSKKMSSMPRMDSSSSSDDYDGEEHIIRIDSPSRLFHPHVPQ
ncbi:hypothetical protein KP509_09G099400 [Ceratopteris richardii]|uniref:Cyclic nucleotide-binding domain-containing protein n=1 Tax=Ceratopteris richardii TaxID=49495 RepID=A0A8T2U532_CERRI|nr:hypothetical protein KP509_09G099400 [Ceratopteris richardii]